MATENETAVEPVCQTYYHNQAHFYQKLPNRETCKYRRQKRLYVDEFKNFNPCSHSSKQLLELSEHIDTKLLKLGDKFDSCENFYRYLHAYAKRWCFYYSCIYSNTLHVFYNCIYSKDGISTDLSHQDKSFKTGCPATIILEICPETQSVTVVRKCNHHNHPLTEEAFENLPHIDQLPYRIKIEVYKMMISGIEPKDIENYIANITGINVKNICDYIENAIICKVPLKALISFCADISFFEDLSESTLMQASARMNTMPDLEQSAKKKPKYRPREVSPHTSDAVETVEVDSNHLTFLKHFNIDHCYLNITEDANAYIIILEDASKKSNEMKIRKKKRLTPDANKENNKIKRNNLVTYLRRDQWFEQCDKHPLLPQHSDPIKCGATFDSYKCFLKYVNEKAKSWYFYYSNNYTCPKGEYEQYDLHCVFFERPPNKNRQPKGLRKRIQTHTKCPCKLLLKRVRGKSGLTVVSACNHHDHPLNEELFSRLQHGRRLPQELKEEILYFISNGVMNKQVLREYVKSKTGVIMPSKFFLAQKHIANKGVKFCSKNLAVLQEKLKRLEQLYGSIIWKNLKAKRESGKSMKTKSSSEKGNSDVVHILDQVSVNGTFNNKQKQTEQQNKHAGEDNNTEGVTSIEFNRDVKEKDSNPLNKTLLNRNVSKDHSLKYVKSKKRTIDVVHALDNRTLQYHSISEANDVVESYEVEEVVDHETFDNNCLILESSALQQGWANEFQTYITTQQNANEIDDALSEENSENIASFDMPNEDIEQSQVIQETIEEFDYEDVIKSETLSKEKLVDRKAYPKCRVNKNACNEHCMSLTENINPIKCGDKFESHDSFVDYINENAKNWLFYYTCLSAHHKRSKKEAAYYIYSCVFHNKSRSKSESKGIRRRTQTYTNCPCEVRLAGRKGSTEGDLMVVYSCSHHDHPLTEEVFNRLQHGRRLPPDLIEEILYFISRGVRNFPLLRQYVKSKVGIDMSLKFFHFKKKMIEKKDVNFCSTKIGSLNSKLVELEELFGNEIWMNKNDRVPKHPKRIRNHYYKEKFIPKHILDPLPIKASSSLELGANEQDEMIVEEATPSDASCERSRLETCLETLSQNQETMLSVNKLLESVRNTSEQKNTYAPRVVIEDITEEYILE